MKNLYFLFIIFVCCLSCETEKIEQQDENLYLINQSDTREFDSFSYPSNQIVVQYKTYLSEAEKQAMRDQYGVVSIKKCECADPTLELWIFGRDGVDVGSGTIEEGVIVLKDDDGVEGANFNPYVKQQGQKLQNAYGPQDVAIARTKVDASNDGVTIAVLDTGIDYNYFGLSGNYLYNNLQNSEACNVSGVQDYFGWDFVNEDNDPFDDYGHGTIVSTIIHDQLTTQSTDFQILPVKVFDENGNGAYFDILCGFQYAAKNNDVDIINMSFGWYNTQYELLRGFIEESQQDKLLVTSAGNIDSDNDIVPHYPSSFESSNLLSVASLTDHQVNIGLASFSNYGFSSVDFAAPGENIPFSVTTQEPIFVSGTSFSAAYTSAFAAFVYSEGMTVSQHKTELLSHLIQHPNLSNIGYGAYLSF